MRALLSNVRAQTGDIVRATSTAGGTDTLGSTVTDAGANVCVFKSEGFKGLAEKVLQVGGATLSEFGSAKPVGPPQQGAPSPSPEQSGSDLISEPPATTTIQPPPDGDHPASGDRPAAQK